MSGEVFYGRTVRRSEGSRTAKGIVGWQTVGSFYFFLEPPHLNRHWIDSQGRVYILVKTKSVKAESNYFGLNTGQMDAKKQLVILRLTNPPSQSPIGL